MTPTNPNPIAERLLEISDREIMEAVNKAFFYNRPDLQYRFDASAPPLLPSRSQATDTPTAHD